MMTPYLLFNLIGVQNIYTCKQNIRDGRRNGRSSTLYTNAATHKKLGRGRGLSTNYFKPTCCLHKTCMKKKKKNLSEETSQCYCRDINITTNLNSYAAMMTKTVFYNPDKIYKSFSKNKIVGSISNKYDSLISVQTGQRKIKIKKIKQKRGSLITHTIG